MLMQATRHVKKTAEKEYVQYLKHYQMKLFFQYWLGKKVSSNRVIASADGIVHSRYIAKNSGFGWLKMDHSLLARELLIKWSAKP